MADLKQIDAFFNGEKSFEVEDKERLSFRARVLRFLKLAMPSVAAVLVALILLFPTLKKNNVVTDFDITLPKKGELEKLHIEQTEFSITDKNNRVSNFTADRIDETTPGSKLMKIINPKGKIPAGSGEGFVNVDADVGYYNQNANTINISQNVKAVYDDGTHVFTETADYDFNKSVGSGDKDIYAYGDWGKLWSEGFIYRQAEELLILTGKSKIVSGERTLLADEQIRYYRAKNIMEAEGRVKIEEKENILYADKAVAYFHDSAMSKLNKIEAFGNVLVITADGTARGDYGLYLPQKSEMELHNNVVITQNGNVVRGQKAVTNLQTSVSRVMSDTKTGKRVSGVIKGSTIKDREK